MKQYNVISLSLNHLPDKGSAYGDYKTLCEKQSALAMDEINDWYNGCQTLSGTRRGCIIQGQLCVRLRMVHVKVTGSEQVNWMRYCFS